MCINADVRMVVVILSSWNVDGGIIGCTRNEFHIGKLQIDKIHIIADRFCLKNIHAHARTHTYKHTNSITHTLTTLCDCREGISKGKSS